MALTNWYATYVFEDSKKDTQDIQIGISAAANDAGFLAANDLRLDLVPLMVPLTQAKLKESYLTLRVPLAGTPAAVAGTHIENKATYVWGDPDGFPIGFSIPCPPDTIFDTNKHDVTMTHADVTAFMDAIVTGAYFNMRGVGYSEALRGYFVARNRLHGRRA